MNLTQSIHRHYRNNIRGGTISIKMYSLSSIYPLVFPICYAIFGHCPLWFGSLWSLIGLDEFCASEFVSQIADRWWFRFQVRDFECSFDWFLKSRSFWARTFCTFSLMSPPQSEFNCLLTLEESGTSNWFFCTFSLISPPQSESNCLLTLEEYGTSNWFFCTFFFDKSSTKWVQLPSHPRRIWHIKLIFLHVFFDKSSTKWVQLPSHPRRIYDGPTERFDAFVPRGTTAAKSKTTIWHNRRLSNRQHAQNNTKEQGHRQIHFPDVLRPTQRDLAGSFVKTLFLKPWCDAWEKKFFNSNRFGERN